MCELFAMSSKKPATVSMTLQKFASHGSDDGMNKDGWGIVYYAEGDLRRFRDTGPAADSEWVKFVEKQALCSTQVLAHIRGANVGSVCLRNTHPFSRELGGKMHTFAHNGYLQDIAKNESLVLQRFRTVGDTDSEWAFCALLDRLCNLWMRDSGVPPMTERIDIIKKFAGEIRGLGLSNFLYSDGDTIFVHADRRRQSDGQFRAPGLWLREQTCPGGDELIAGGGVKINSPKQTIAMAASVPLTECGWEPMEEGALVALKEGRIIATASPITGSHESNLVV